MFKKKIIVFFIISIFLSTTITASSLQIKTEENADRDLIPIDSDYIPGEIILKFEEDAPVHFSKSFEQSLITNIDSINVLNQKYNILSSEKLYKEDTTAHLSKTYKIKIQNNADIKRAIKEYNNDPNIEYAEPNYIYSLQLIPNDDYFFNQWALNQNNDCDIDAPEAWDIAQGNENIIVAVIDTGIDLNHPDLKANIVQGKNCVNPLLPPKDEFGHGTHCAGIISAVTNNNEGIAGISWNCKIMPIKTYIDLLGGILIEAIATGIIWAVDNGADVISMSLGGTSPSRTVQDAIEYADSKGVVLVAAAGNDGNNRINYPAGHDSVISVVATDSFDKIADFSNYGDWVDIAAPGVGIYSTLPTYHVRMNDNDYGYKQNYDYCSGTSMACPYVAGLAALLLSKNPDLTPDMVKNIIYNTADEIETTKDIGRGRINAYEAIKREPALAKLDPFKDWTDVHGWVNIKGTAWGENFQYYTIEYGKGSNPQSWTEIKTSSKPVQNGSLALFNSKIGDGLYTLRMRLFCDDGLCEEKALMVINNNIETLHVRGTGSNSYNSIKTAINDAGKGDTVYVHCGTYYENFTIDRSIIIRGENKENTIIDGGGKGVVVTILADNVEITEFTIRNCGDGIYDSAIAAKADNTIITNNIIIVEARLCGILVAPWWIPKINPKTNINGNILKDNEVRNTWGCGIKFGDCSQSNVEGNKVSYCYLNSCISLYACSDITVHKNNLTDSYSGISLFESYDNIITYNNITNNHYGIKIKELSKNNQFYHNNLINNEKNAEISNNILDKNFWDNGRKSGGNYWDDYVEKYGEINNNKDSFWDVAYKVSEGKNDKDNYPLVNPYNGSIDKQKSNSESLEKTRLRIFNNDIIRSYFFKYLLLHFPFLNKLTGLRWT